MPNQYCERWEGPIRGLRLPLAAWNRLQEEGITTIDQLQAAADRPPGSGIPPSSPRSSNRFITAEGIARMSSVPGFAAAISRYSVRARVIVSV